MRTFVTGSLLVALVAAAELMGDVAGGDSPVVARWHFLGTTQLTGNTNAARLRAVLAQASTKPVVERALNGLSRAASHEAQGAAIVRSLLDEGLRSESFGMIRGELGSEQEAWSVALRVGSAQAQHWAATWPALGAAVRMNRTTSAVSGDWFLGGFSRGSAPDLKGLEDQVAGAGRSPPAAAAGLELDVDLARLAKAWSWPASIPWPRAHLAFLGKGLNLRTTARFVYDRPLVLPLEPWRAPTNTVREPLLSFTAIQGVRPWLTEHSVLKDLGWPVPNQVFAWAQSQVPYQTQFAWQMPEAAARIQEAKPKIEATGRGLFPWLNFGELEFNPDGHRLFWRGFPIIVPFVQPAADAGFVLAGIFPVANPKEVAPPELYAQLWGRTNLVYYDWELTQPRLADLLALKTLHAILAGHAPPSTNSVVLPWLQDTNVTGHLGNCVTELTQVSPRELQLVRSSAMGLTAFELHQAALWLDGEDFPRRTPPKIVVVFGKAAGTTNPPATDR